MKRILFMATMLAITTIMLAQEGTINLGATLDYSRRIERYRAMGQKAGKLTADPTNGFKVGLVVEGNIIKGFGVNMGLNYGLTASSTKWESNPNALLLKTKKERLIHTIEIPVDWQYKFEIAKQTYLILYTGPTLQVGLSDRSTTRTRMGNSKADVLRQQRYELDLDQDGRKDYNRANVLWGVGAGFQYKQYFLRGGYDFGVMPQYKDRFDDVLSWNRQGRNDQWQIKLGIYFHQFHD